MNLKRISGFPTYLLFVLLSLTVFIFENCSAEETSPNSEEVAKPLSWPAFFNYPRYDSDKNYPTGVDDQEETSQLAAPALERLRRSLVQIEELSATPSRRSASHPCRWKLCGAHFGYNSVRRL